jgi:hypothetical protein
LAVSGHYLGKSHGPNPAFGPVLEYWAYILAETLSVPGLKAAMMDVLFDSFQDEEMHWYLNCVHVVYVFDRLTDSDPLLRLFVDVCCARTIFYFN